MLWLVCPHTGTADAITFFCPGNSPFCLLFPLINRHSPTDEFVGDQ
jgi:hypothetical protein